MYIMNLHKVFVVCLSTVFIRIFLYLRWKTAEREVLYIFYIYIYIERRSVLSYKNTLGYVNNNMFTSAIRKINKLRDPCQVLRTATRHVSVLISINALPSAPRGSTTPGRQSAAGRTAALR